MAAYVKFQIFVQDRNRKVHNLNSDSLKLLLTNTAPNVADTVVDTTTTPPQLKSTSSANEIAAGNGYTAGGAALTGTSNTQTSGTAKQAGTFPSWTASGGTIGPFRYIVLYNNTGGTSATRPVIAYWDRGTSLTLQDGDSFVPSPADATAIFQDS